MISPIIKKDNHLFAIDENQNHLLVQNAFKGLDGFYLCHGWYIYKDTINLEKEFEIEILDQSTCRIIKEIKNA